MEESLKKLIVARAVRTEGERRGMKYFVGGGSGGAPKSSKPAARAGKKAGKRGAKKAKATGSKAEAVPIAAAA